MLHDSGKIDGSGPDEPGRLLLDSAAAVRSRGPVVLAVSFTALEGELLLLHLERRGSCNLSEQRRQQHECNSKPGCFPLHRLRDS